MSYRQEPKRGRGRPAKYLTDEERRKANAEAARAYRVRKRAEKEARQVAARTAQERERLQASTIIDLSALSYSGKGSG